MLGGPFAVSTVGPLAQLVPDSRFQDFSLKPGPQVVRLPTFNRLASGMRYDATALLMLGLI